MPSINTNVPPLSSSPSSIASRAASNALNRAISLASKKLFGSGSPSPGPSRDRESPRRPAIVTVEEAEGAGERERGRERDPLEDELLAALEELAQKTDVLTHWADEMYEYVKAVPQSQFSPFFVVVLWVLVVDCADV